MRNELCIAIVVGGGRRSDKDENKINQTKSRRPIRRCYNNDMNIIIKKTLDVTPPLEEYIHEKFGTLEKFIQAFDDAAQGGLTLRCEVARTNERHKKGDDIYQVTALLALTGHELRADGSAAEAHAAVDRTRDILREEIERYKEKRSEEIRRAAMR